MIGQVLYLEAEAAGARGTGIGCFYDDAVHELLGLAVANGKACITSRWGCRSTTPAHDGTRLRLGSSRDMT